MLWRGVHARPAVALALAFILSCHGSDDPSGSSTTSSTTSSSSSSDGPVVPGGIGAACEVNAHCKDGLWCEATMCDHKWAGGYCSQFCEVDEDCATVDGKPGSCRFSDGSNTQLACVWVCESDSDCPSSLDVTFSCGGTHQTYKTCERACGT